MKISMVSFTENGYRLSEKIQKSMERDQIQLFSKCSSISSRSSEVSFVDTPIGEWTKEQMRKKHALVFVGACGIAVRAIAPHLVSKLDDSPVIVIDEKGRFVIPVLSGHVGGANELAVMIAGKIGAEPVITTATDINRKFAIDLFAKKNGLAIENKDGIAKVSAKILRGEKIKISMKEEYVDSEKCLPEEIEMIPYPPMEIVDVVIVPEGEDFDALLTLRLKEYVIGAGCRKGKDPEEFASFIDRMLERAGVKKQEVFALASIDLKADEPAMFRWCARNGILFQTFSKEELEEVTGGFKESEFVKQTVGIGNVCERAALRAAGNGGRLIAEKYAEDGMTIAIAKREWRVTFDEE